MIWVLIMPNKELIDSWYIVDAVGDGSMGNPHRPKHADKFESYSCHRLGNSNKFLVRYYGTRKTHNTMSKKRSLRDVGDNGIENRLNAVFSGNRGPNNLNAAGWKNNFFVNKGDKFDISEHDT